MNLLILAASFISFVDPYNPSQTITLQDTEINMPAQTPISPMERIIDRQVMSRPSLQRGGYDFNDLESRYPTRSPVPVAERQVVPLEVQLAETEFQNEQMAREVDIRGRLLNQQINQKQMVYTDNVNKQAEEAMPLIARIDPRSEDYELQVAEFNERYPLAFQNPGFTRQFENLKQTNEQWRANKEIKTQYAVRADDQENYAARRAEERMLQEVAKFGEGALAEYNASLEEDARNGQLADPYKAFARASTVIAQKQREVAETKPITTSEFRSLVGLKAKILENASIDELEPSQRAELEAIQGQINSYLAPRSNTQGAPTSRIAPPTNFFPKSSTKTGP